MSGLCKYSDMFGAPGTGVHSYRFFDIAVIDYSLTVVVAILISYYYKWNFTYVLVGLFLFGIVAHRVFCVRTTIDRMLFG